MSIIKSKYTGKEYDDDHVVWYKNAMQSAFMCNHGAELLDIVPTEENRFMFIFSWTDHKRLISDWNATRPQKDEV